MTRLVLDDHLLRDLLAGASEPAVKRLAGNDPTATTNLFYLRLCRSIVAAPGGTLTGRLPDPERAELGRALVALPEAIDVVPIRMLAFDMAQLAQRHRLSSLGAEAVAAARLLGATLCVWDGDDGPGIRAAARAERVPYRTIERS